MKGGKYKDKHLDPLFPRIHINDAEKGGPRAPPRNKMALCEQLSTHSNKFTSGSMSILALPPGNGSSLVRSASSSHVVCLDTSQFFSCCNSPGSSDLAGRLHHHASSAVNLNRTQITPELRQLTPKSYETLSATGRWTMTVGRNLFQPCSFSSSKNSHAEKVGEQDDLRVSSFVPLRSLNDDNARQSINNQKHNSSYSNSSVKLQTGYEKQLKETSCRDPKVNDFMEKLAVQVSNVSQSAEHHIEKPTSLLSTGEKILTDAAGILPGINKNVEPDTNALVVEYFGKRAEGNHQVPQSSENHTKRPSVLLTGEKISTDSVSNPLIRERDAEPNASAFHSPSQKRNSSFLDDISKLHDPCALIDQENRILQESKAANLETSTRKRSASEIECPLFSIQRIGYNQRSPRRLDSVNEYPDDQDCGSVRVSDIDRSDGKSETSAKDLTSDFIVSPDNVASVIGQKQFWKARRTIVHQQRIFTLQIFELHRLIKVQRLMAESPEMLFKNNFYFDKSSIKFSPVKKSLAEKIQETSPLTVQEKAGPQKPNPGMECAAESASGKQQSLFDDTQKGLSSLQSTPKPSPQTLISPPMAADVKFPPWCILSSPGNQWLIPVRSPSEGLVYKPYIGPYPPNAGFFAPCYGSCGPISLSAAGGNFLNTGYCVPASGQQGIENLSTHTAPGKTYFQPYARPVINASGSNSTVERIRPLAKAYSSEHDACVPPCDTDPIIPYQSSCNLTSQKSASISDCRQHLQGSKGSDFQGSTARSPTQEKQGDALTLFPTTPSIHVAHQTVRCPSPEQRIQVIKVKPHNRKSASESAARIFRAILDERKQYE